MHQPCSNDHCWQMKAFYAIELGIHFINIATKSKVFIKLIKGFVYLAVVFNVLPICFAIHLQLPSVKQCLESYQSNILSWRASSLGMYNNDHLCHACELTGKPCMIIISPKSYIFLLQSPIFASLPFSQSMIFQRHRWHSGCSNSLASFWFMYHSYLLHIVNSCKCHN